MLNATVLRKTLKAAINSGGIGQGYNYKLAAAVFNSKKEYTIGTNSYKTHPILTKYSKYPCLHAEASAIIKHGLDKVKGCSILVVRVLANGNLSMAKPCCSCQNFIKDVGIKRVFYSNWKGEIQSYDTTKE